MHNELIINSMYCNISLPLFWNPVRHTVIILASADFFLYCTYHNVVRDYFTCWRQGGLTLLAKNAPSISIIVHLTAASPFIDTSMCLLYIRSHVRDSPIKYVGEWNLITNLNKTSLFLFSLSPLSLLQKVVAGKWKGVIDMAIKMIQKGSTNEEDLIEEAKIMK